MGFSMQPDDRRRLRSDRLDPAEVATVDFPRMPRPVRLCRGWPTVRTSEPARRVACYEAPAAVFSATTHR